MSGGTGFRLLMWVLLFDVDAVVDVGATVDVDSAVDVALVIAEVLGGRGRFPAVARETSKW